MSEEMMLFAHSPEGFRACRFVLRSKSKAFTKDQFANGHTTIFYDIEVMPTEPSPDALYGSDVNYIVLMVPENNQNNAEYDQLNEGDEFFLTKR